MANSKISALTAATTPLDGTEVLPIVQSSTTKKVSNNDLRPKQIQSNATSGVMQIAGPAAAATRVMTIPDANFTAARTDASQSFTGDQTLSTGNLIQGTAAKGINFTANSAAAGKTSQLLNWYEEGTWTPVGNGITLSAASGRYVRIGSQVTLFFEIVFPTTADTSVAQVSGLPFSASTNFRNGAAIGFTTDTTGNVLVAYNSLIQIYNTSGAQTTNASNSTKQYYGSLSYRI